MGNGEAKELKELICMTHGHELSWENDGGKWGTGQRRKISLWNKKNGTTIIAQSIKC